MKKLVNIFLDKYKVLIPIMVVLVLLITTFFLYREYKFDNQRNKSEEKVYQYFTAGKIEYTGIITYNLKNVIVDFNPKEIKIQENVVPIYYSDKSKVIFPVDMSIVFPHRSGMQYRLYKYATYYKLDGVNFIKNNTDEGKYDDFFLYNGKDTFFFPEETTLLLGGKEYKKLGAMSFVRVVGGYTLIYYDTATDSFEVIELDGRDVVVTSDYVNVNVKNRYFYSFNTKVFFMSPNNLDPVFKTIDK